MNACPADRSWRRNHLVTQRSLSKSVPQRLAGLDVAAWYVLVFVCLSIPILLDRAGMIDNDSYVDYFVNGKDFAWTRTFVEVDTWLQFASRLVTEEVLWLAWTSFLGTMFAPQDSVYLTAFLLNLLIVVTLSRAPNRSTALALWIFIPFGFAVIGTYQLRQGFAFALWLYLAIRRERLVLGSVAAAMIHTTFIVVALLSILAAWRKWSEKARLASLVVTATALALAGNSLFAEYGGRRVTEAAVIDPEPLSLNFLLGLVVVVAYPTYLVLFEQRAFHKPSGNAAALRDYVLLYVGTVSFLIASFFVFPIGNFRLPYIAWLGLIPIVGYFDFGRALQDPQATRRALIGLGVILVFLLYQSVGAALSERYACVLHANCASLLFK